MGEQISFQDPDFIFFGYLPSMRLLIVFKQKVMLCECPWFRKLKGKGKQEKYGGKSRGPMLSGSQNRRVRWDSRVWGSR